MHTEIDENTGNEDSKVVNTVRRAVVAAAGEATMLKSKTSDFARKVSAFSKDVRRGVEEGLKEVRSKDKGGISEE